MLRGRRAAWVERFGTYDKQVKADEVALEERQQHYVALLNECAKIWEETREKKECEA